MNTRDVENFLVSLGFRLEKRKIDGFDKQKWFVVDQDNIPVASHHYRGELVRRVEKDLGGLK